MNPYWKRIRDHRALLLLLVPAMIYYIVFHYAPMLGMQIAFRDYKLLAGIWRSPWVGLENFRDMFGMSLFTRVFRNTVVISGLKLLVSFPAPIVFAILLSELSNATFKRVSQTISYLPHFLSWVVLSGIFIQLLSPTLGPFGAIFKALGGEMPYLMGSNRYFRGVLVATAVWKSFGWNSVVYFAAITNVNPELLEAAAIDGAGRFRRILHVTLPALTPVITLMLIMSVGTIVSDDFDQIFNLLNPAVKEVGDVLGTYIYHRGFENMDYSFATAAGLFQNVISFGLILIVNGAARRISDYGIW